TDVAVGGLEPAQGHVERRLLVVDRDTQRRDELAEQAPPRALARDRLLCEDLLLGLREQVRAVATSAAQVGAAELEPVRAQQLLRAAVVERRPLELEEQQLGLDRGRLLLHLLK